MILNSSGTTGYDQILKQITYGGKKVREKEEILRMEEGDMEEREKKIWFWRDRSVTKIE